MKLIATGKQILLFLIFLFTASVLSAQGLSLTAELSDDQVWLGDSVQLMLYLQGSEEAISPELNIPGVNVEPLGGTVRSSRSVTSINGKVTEDIRKAYVCSYRLTPTSPGRIVIPSIEVNVEGQTLKSSQAVLAVREPAASDDFSLELEFDRNAVYIDERVYLKIGFFYGQSLRTLELSIPGLEGLNYESMPVDDERERYEILINGNPVIFGRDDKGNFAGLSALISIRPEMAGQILLQRSTASFESVSGYKRVQDFFGRIQNQEVYSRTVIPGNTTVVDVLPFPKFDQPEDFFGLSGDIDIDVVVTPQEVHIGDPITLTLNINKMNNPDVAIPPLGRYLGGGIDIPDTRASAAINGSTKTITQTIRISEDWVTEIPTITFPYFDPDAEKYKNASSAAVPLTVLETKIVTSAELEGVSQTGDPTGKVLLERKKEGIYHNYTGKKLLQDSIPVIERLQSSFLIKFLLLVPPAAFIAVLILTRIRPHIRRRASARIDKHRDLRKLKKQWKKVDFSNVHDVLKLFNRQVSVYLERWGLPDDDKLIHVLEALEAAVYGRVEIEPLQAQELTAEILILLDEGVKDAE
ncbi:MAG: BatD family protein [Spirochaetales bacterium]|uniref:BatD family protein n=1 Tax=Candidatus Thalassospirochaeta sargassi TaxID=3119039 RepID=A0AAJ1IHI0_9SPIO|nr:BatD family protein [Spirochaetales bacterium]